jgi:hypothetical protein
MSIYCVKCKAKTDTKDVQNVSSANNRPMVKGICVVCGKNKSQFVKGSRAPLGYQSAATGGDLVSSLNKITSKIKLPWATFPGEMHLPGHSFTGPGTRLDLRLNPDGSFKDWSKPVDRVDNAAYHHDLAYAQHSDTADRNVADGVMVAELNNIKNPTLRERAERAVVIPIIASKAAFGLGLGGKKKQRRRLKPR